MLLSGTDHSHLRREVELFFKVFPTERLSFIKKEKTPEGFYFLRHQTQGGHVALMLRAVVTNPPTQHWFNRTVAYKPAIDSFMPALCFFCNWGPLRALLRESCLQPPEFSANPGNKVGL